MACFLLHSPLLSLALFLSRSLFLSSLTLRVFNSSHPLSAYFQFLAPSLPLSFTSLASLSLSLFLFPSPPLLRYYEQDIQVSLDQLVDRGVSEECYFSLADLECSACGPNQLSYIQWDGPADDDDGYDDDDNDDADDDEDFFDQRYTFRLCPRFCDQVFSGCKGDALLLGADASGTATTFCESIQGSVLTADKNDVSGIFLNTNFVVSDFDCYAGAPIEDVEAGVGVCLDDFTAVKFRPVYPDESSSSASAMVISSVLAIAALLALVL